MTDARDLETKDKLIAWTYAYANALDTRQFEDLPALFDPKLESHFGNVVSRGPDEFASMVASHLGGCGPSQHLFSNHRVSIAGNTAQVVFYANIMHAGTGDNADTFFQVWSEYTASMVRVRGVWRATLFDQRIIKTDGDMSILKP